METRTLKEMIPELEAEDLVMCASDDSVMFDHGEVFTVYKDIEGFFIYIRNPYRKIRYFTSDFELFEEKHDNNDPVNNPSHYTSHPSGVECLDVTRHMSFNLGNAIKYIWRCDLKQDAIEDLEKAVFYINDEIKKRKENANG